MTVIHVVAPGEIGGLERVVQTLAAGQAAVGEDVHVAVVLDRASPNHRLVDGFASSGVTPHPIVLPAHAYWRERDAIRELFRRLRPRVVHTHGYRPDLVDAGVARQMGVPTVTTVHGFTGGDWKNRLYERLQRRAYRRFNAVIVVSRALAGRLSGDGIPADRIHILQNVWQETVPPLDRATARQLLGVSEDGFRIGWVGRLSAEKGADVLIDALPLVSDLPLGVSIVGAGSPGEERSLLARAQRLGVADRIQWHGLVPDASRLFKAFDVFVLSSRTEGTPIVLLEAMAAGVPIVAACVGGVPDLLTPAEALLVRPANPAGPPLAAAIRAVYQDPAAAHERAQRARERLLADFTVAPWVRRYEAVYRLVTGNGAGPV